MMSFGMDIIAFFVILSACPKAFLSQSIELLFILVSTKNEKPPNEDDNGVTQKEVINPFVLQFQQKPLSIAEIEL